MGNKWQGVCPMSDLTLNILLLVVLVLGCLLALMIGHADIELADLTAVLLGHSGEPGQSVIVWEIRVPRIITGVLVGTALGMSGAALQGLLRNPLADPGVIGVSASAGFGAVLAIQYGFVSLSPLILPGFAMLGAAGSIAILYLLSNRDSSILTLILVGVGINALAGAFTSLAINFSANPFALSEMVLWLLGSLANRSYTDIALALPFILLGVGCLLMAGPSLRLLTLGEDVGRTLGVSLNRTRWLIVGGVGLSVGAAVAIAGMIGFVGLVIPHITRPLVGHDPQRLLIPSGLCGAILIVFADALIRLLPATVELKLGVVTALLGGPFFLYLVIKTRRRMQ